MSEQPEVKENPADLVAEEEFMATANTLFDRGYNCYHLVLLLLEQKQQENSLHRFDRYNENGC